MPLNFTYLYGEEVMLVTDPEYHIRLVTGHIVRNGYVQYLLCLGEKETTHYEVEIKPAKEQQQPAGFKPASL